MAKVAATTFLLLSRRAYAAAAKNERVATVASTASKAADLSRVERESVGGQKEVFWMRDPKTGNWIPETHFCEVDVAELREKFLGKKATKL